MQIEALVTHQPLSFWGGYDFKTGTIIDKHHPLAGVCAEHPGAEEVARHHADRVHCGRCAGWGMRCATSPNARAR